MKEHYDMAAGTLKTTEQTYPGILFFDIDGTIITEDGRHFIPESTRQAIRDARDRGYLLFINTGRVFLNVEAMIRDLGFDGYVCGCGTNIRYQGYELLHYIIPKDIQTRTVERIRKSKMNVIFEASDMNALDVPVSINPELAELADYFSRDGRRMVSVTDPSFHFDKFTGWYRKEDQVLHDEFRKFADIYYEYTDRGESDGWRMCEIVPKGYSKGTGIRYLLTYFRIDMENCYVFGDSTNDLPMFREVVHSVAMGGSPQVVLDSVEYVTDTITEDGLYRAMLHYGLIG